MRARGHLVRIEPLLNLDPEGAGRSGACRALKRKESGKAESQNGIHTRGRLISIPSLSSDMRDRKREEENYLHLSPPSPFQSLIFPGYIAGV